MHAELAGDLGDPGLAEPGQDARMVSARSTDWTDAGASLVPLRHDA